MQIKSVVETADGTVQVEADLKPEQVKFLVEIGLNTLLRDGAELFSHKKEFTAAQLAPFSEQTQ